MNSSDVIEQLDEEAKSYDFPMLNNLYFANADIRLKVFRSPSEWLLIFEELSFCRNPPDFIDGISVYGNQVDNPGSLCAVPVIKDQKGSSLWNEDGDFLLDRWSFEVEIGGKLLSFSLTEEDYRKAGIDTSAEDDYPAQILRYLSFLYSDDLFQSDSFLLKQCGKNTSGLTKLIQLDDWYHPDIADDELPSQTETFQKLAEAIVSGDSSLYLVVDEEPNTHWSNWSLDE